MATKYEPLFDAFLKRVERDKDFFAYLNVSPMFAQEVIHTRCVAFLNEACGRMMLTGMPSVDFFNKDDEAETFMFDLTSTEKYILTSLMYEAYLSREIAYLKSVQVNYVPSDLKVYDPSNWRSTFMQMYNTVCEENNRLLDAYSSKDRASGAYLSVDQSVNIDS